MSEETAKAQMDPYKTMCVCKHNDREVGRIAATADNAQDYIEELARQYGTLSVEYVPDENAGLLANFRRPYHT